MRSADRTTAKLRVRDCTAHDDCTVYRLTLSRSYHYVHVRELGLGNLRQGHLTHPRRRRSV